LSRRRSPGTGAVAGGAIALAAGLSRDDVVGSALGVVAPTAALAVVLPRFVG
jgi:hypothetical protein